MILNYFKIIRRNIWRHPMHAALNLACLTIGVAGTLLILLYLNFELTYDTYHENADRIFHIDTKAIKTHDKTLDVNWGGTPANLAPYIQQDYPGVEAYTRFYQFWPAADLKLQFNENFIEETNIYATDPAVFDMFTFKLMEGDKTDALKGPNKIVLSETLAKRIFGNKPAIGQLLSSNLNHVIPDYPSAYTLLVTGIYQDLPENLHLRPKALISAETDLALEAYYFNRFNVDTYLLLSAETDPSTLGNKLSDIYINYLDAAREPVMVFAKHALTPIKQIHLEESGGLTYIFIFGAIGLMLLLIAGISYVNLTTAQASRRALEIGIRKVMGSQNSQLIFQFLSESLFFTITALLLAILLLAEGIPFLNDMLNLRLHLHQLWQPTLLAGIVGIIVLLGILGGSYPAFFLSRLAPVKVIKGKTTKKVPLRKVLVSIQLSAVIFILTSTGMIYQQLQFLRNKDLGFDKEHVINFTIPNEDNLASKYASLKNSLLQNPDILGVGTSSFTPGNSGMFRRPIAIDGSPNQEQQFVYSGYIDEDFFEIMDIDMSLGRSFSSNSPGDSSNILVNEALVRAFELKEPIGDKLRLGGKGNPNFYTIIGVVKDFHQSSLYTPIESQIFILQQPEQVYAKIGKDIPKSLQYIEQSWAKVFPNESFTFSFIEDEIQDGYMSDQIRGKVFFLLAVFTIFIAFLGLFGLASYLATQRIKEIGIRKVLGASVNNLVFLITRDFIILTLLAALPAFALAWYTIDQWLVNFAFRIDINYTLFGLSLVFTLLLTFATTGLHAWRAARVNPLKNLRYE